MARGSWKTSATGARGDLPPQVELGRMLSLVIRGPLVDVLRGQLVGARAGELAASRTRLTPSRGMPPEQPVGSGRARSRMPSAWCAPTCSRQKRPVLRILRRVSEAREGEKR